MVLVEFDYLVTKDKIEDGENFKDFLNPVVSYLSNMAYTGRIVTTTEIGSHARRLFCVVACSKGYTICMHGAYK